MRTLVLFAWMFLLSLVACSPDGDETNLSQNAGNSQDTDTPTGTDGYNALINETRPIPEDYEEEAEQRGSIVRIDYDTRDYAEGTDAVRTNTAYVYLPYGYGEDSHTCYNILYLVHGHYGTASTYFEVEDGMLRKLLDQMIARGDIDPMIVVTPTYNYGSPTNSYVAADPYCEALPQELLNDLMPVVESRYRTYAATADAEGFRASREHRAIGGFSMGAVTTWYALEHSLDYFKYFLPISADCWSLGTFAGMNRPDDTAAYLAGIIRDSGYEGTGFYIWAASGTSDSAYSETLLQIEGMARLGEVFDTRNLTFHQKEGARHEYRPTMEYIYNALPFFFPKATN